LQAALAGSCSPPEYLSYSRDTAFAVLCWAIDFLTAKEDIDYNVANFLV
jgi:hypothetical protein